MKPLKLNFLSETLEVKLLGCTTGRLRVHLLSTQATPFVSLQLHSKQFTANYKFAKLQFTTTYKYCKLLFAIINNYQVTNKNYFDHDKLLLRVCKLLTESLILAQDERWRRA